MTLKQQSITYTNENNTHLLLARMNVVLRHLPKTVGRTKFPFEESYLTVMIRKRTSVRVSPLLSDMEKSEAILLYTEQET